jgi:hypothetical protein
MAIVQRAFAPVEESEENMKALNKEYDPTSRCPDPACVVKVGGGRGFIVEQEIQMPAPPGKTAKWTAIRWVITAAHCLPHLPPTYAGAAAYERTFTNLLGALGDSETTIAAECKFADPVADIAVLGSPDYQLLGDVADAFDALTETAPVVQIGEARNGNGYVLSLEGHWISTKLEKDFWGNSLLIDPTEEGMSGSPILNLAGQAVGVVVIGAEIRSKSGERTNLRCGPQPILVNDLPARLLRAGRKTQD